MVAAPLRRRRATGRLRRLGATLPRIAWALLAVAFLLRLAVVLGTVNTPLSLDPADFSGHGWAIAQGHFPPSNRAPAGGPSAFRPPGYPAFLGAIYWLSGQEAPPVARIVEALLGTLSAGLTGLIALRLWGRRAGIAALGIAAVAPPMVVLSTALVSEALFVPLVLGAVAAAVEARRSPRPLRWAALVGVLLGLAQLTRTNAAVLLIPLGIAVWTARPRWRLRALAAPALVAVAMALTVAPWTIRNAVAFHAFVPVSTQVGYTLAGTYNMASREDRGWPAVWKEAEHGASPEYQPLIWSASIHRWNERVLGDKLRDLAIKDIRAHPGYVLTAGWWNTVRMFHLGELNFGVANLRDTDIPWGPAWLAIAGFYPLAALALGGLLTRRFRRGPWWLWLVPALLWTTVFVTGFIRFRAPIDPFLALLAALAVAALWERRDGRRDEAAYAEGSDRAPTVAGSPETSRTLSAGAGTAGPGSLTTSVTK